MNKTEQLKKIFEVLDQGRPSTKEVAALVREIIVAVKDAQAMLRKEVARCTTDNKQEIEQRSAELKSAIRELNQIVKDTDKKTKDEFYKSLNNEVYKLEKCIGEIPEFDSAPLEAKFSEVIKDLDRQIKALNIPTIIEIRDGLGSLRGDERLSKDAIKGLDEIEEKIKNIELRPTGGRVGGAKGIQLLVDGTKKGNIASLNLIAGSGVTLTYSQAYGRNDVTISASSGSFAVVAVTGTIDDSNVTFTVATEPVLVVINGASYTSTGGAITWTWVAGTLTLSSPVGTGGNIYSIS
jgi:hypothetical protein